MTEPTTYNAGDLIYKGVTIVGYVGNSEHCISGVIEYFNDENTEGKIIGAHLHADVNNNNAITVNESTRIAPLRFFPEIDFVR